MHLRTQRLGGVVISIVALVIGHRAAAQLARLSPFESRISAIAAPVETPLEYMGFIQTSDGLQFRLRATAQKAAAFVRLDVPDPDPDPDLGVVARQHDRESGALTVEHRGRTLTLAEPKAKVRASGVTGARLHAYPTPLTTQMPAAVTQAVVLNPTPAQETVRLESIAAEINRRREERARAPK